MCYIHVHVFVCVYMVGTEHICGGQKQCQVSYMFVVYVHTYVQIHKWKTVKHWTLEELQAFVKFVAWVLRSELQSHYFTAGPSNHGAPFSSTLPVPVCLCVCLCLS